ncbi:hypothetical protein [Rhizobium rhizoryzae]|uniref:hypothetical protein n=1 Tax=Rhizobium rhizoryzae TaxID=451876 RepID=UPI00289BC4AA|nr:hypothetical protein [Rhizobium rhizoryzae]
MVENEEMTPDEARDDHWQMLRFLGFNAGFGFAIGLLIAVALVWMNVGDLGTRMARSANPPLVFFMLSVPLAFTFASAVLGSAVMLMPYKRKKQLKG